MGLNRQDKAAVIEEVAGIVANSSSIVIAEYRGLSVEAVTKLRDGLNAQPTVFGDDNRGRVGNDASNFFNDSSLILTIKTHGLAPLRGVPFRERRFLNNRHTSESFG